MADSRLVPEGFQLETDEDRAHMEQQKLAQAYLDRSKPTTLPEGFVLEGRKSVGTVIKHGLEVGGVRLVKSLVGKARQEHELGGKYRDWFWNSGAGKALGGKPGFTQKIEDALGEWVDTMSGGLEQYYRDNSEVNIQLDEDAGFLDTSIDILSNPEKLLQGVVEAVPLMLEAALGTVVAGPGGGIMVMSQAKAGESYMDARDEGTDIIPALFQAELTGLGEAAIEQWTFGKKLGLAKGFSEMVKKGGKKILWEGMKAYSRGAVEEGTQTFNENLWRYVFTDREQELFEGVGSAAAMGGPLELIMSGGFAAGGKVKGKAQQMLKKGEQHKRVDHFRQAVNNNPVLSEKSKTELNEEFDRVDSDIDIGVYEFSSPEEGATEAFEMEFSEVVQEGQVYSQSQVADSIVEGKEIEPVSTLVEEDTRSEGQKSIDNLNSAIENSAIETARELTKEERTIELGKRVGKAKERRTKALKRPGTTIRDAQDESRAELAGEMPKATFERFTDEEVSSQDFENIRAEILGKGLQYFQEEHSLEAIKKLQMGMVPTNSEMRALGLTIGQSRVAALQEASKGIRAKVYDFSLNLFNFNTTMLASGEISFMFRQALLALVRFPKSWAKGFGDSFAAYFSEGKAELLQKEMQTRKRFEQAQKSGVDFNELDGEATKTEERFQSKWAEALPYYGALVRASKRAATVGMNKIRADIFDIAAENWEGLGKDQSEYDTIGKIANLSTGRTNITNKKVRAILPFLTAGFFSPQLNMARFEFLGRSSKALVAMIPGKWTGKSTPASRIMASQLLTFIAAGGMVMTLASMMGLKVEKDWHSSDFGKIILGRLRVDVWGGYQQIVRTVVQIASGKGKAVSSGEHFTKNRLESFGRFIQSKLNPPVSLGVELLSGKTFLGEPIPDFKNTAEFTRWALYEKFTPLFTQDTIDAVRFAQSKAANAVVFPLAFLGVGVQTYAPNALDDLSQMRNHYSMDIFGKEWNNLGPLAQEALRNEKPQIPEQELIAKFERRNATFDIKRQREAGIKVEKSLPRPIQDEMDSLNVTLGGLSRTIVRNWRLNAELYQKYQDDLSLILGKALPKIIGAPSYKEQKPEDRQKILEWVIKQSKAAVRKQIVMEANMKDIEDISKGVEDE